MTDSMNELKEKIKRGIAKSGFPLEMEIGNALRSKNWYTNHSPRYFDLDDLQFREYDIKASKMGGNFDTQLYIECKCSANKQWVFFVPDRYEGIYVQDLRFFPIKNGVQYRFDRSLLKDTIFGALDKYCDSSEVALNDSIFQGDQKGKERNEDAAMREAIKTSVKALIAENVARYIIRPGIPGIRPRMNFAIVVFDGYIFSYIQRGNAYKLENREYVKYRHEQNINLWNHPEDVKKNPFIGLCTQYELDVGTSYVVEIVHKNFFSQYLSELDKSIELLNKTPNLDFKEAISRWFDSYPDISILPRTSQR